MEPIQHESNLRAERRRNGRLAQDAEQRWTNAVPDVSPLSPGFGKAFSEVPVRQSVVKGPRAGIEPDCDHLRS